MKRRTLFVLIFIGLTAVAIFGRIHTSGTHDRCSCDQELIDDGDFVVQYYHENKNRYCYSVRVPHGDIWQELCFDTKSGCQSELANETRRVNTDTCYQPAIVPAWCVDDIITGEYRADDFTGEMYELLARVCVRDLEKCDKLRQYQSPFSKSECVAHMVFLHESESSYLTPDYELETIERNNQYK